jgi:hypothetical protein
MGTTDDDAIGCGVSAWGLAKSGDLVNVTVSVEGIRTSSVSPLEDSCKDGTLFLMS